MQAQGRYIGLRHVHRPWVGFHGPAAQQQKRGEDPEVPCRDARENGATVAPAGAEEGGGGTHPTHVLSH